MCVRLRCAAKFRGSLRFNGAGGVRLPYSDEAALDADFAAAMWVRPAAGARAGTQTLLTRAPLLSGGRVLRPKLSSSELYPDGALSLMAYEDGVAVFEPKLAAGVSVARHIFSCSPMPVSWRDRLFRGDAYMKPHCFFVSAGFYAYGSVVGCS